VLALWYVQTWAEQCQLTRLLVQLGAQIGSRVLDFAYSQLKKRNNGVATPEMRLPLLAVGSFMLPIGLLIYGWTAEVSESPELWAQTG
jgi:hypothetical protein